MNKIICLVMLSMFLLNSAFSLALSSALTSNINIVLQSAKPIPQEINVLIRQSENMQPNICKLISNTKVLKTYLATYQCKGDVLKSATIILKKSDATTFESKYALVGKIRQINIDKIIFGSVQTANQTGFDYIIIASECNLNKSLISFMLLNRGSAISSNSLIKLMNQNGTEMQTGLVFISLNNNETKKFEIQSNVTKGNYLINVDIQGRQNTAYVNCI